MSKSVPTNKLLVVDDEPAVQQFFCRVFDSPEYEIVNVESAAGALEALDSSEPDAIILDLVLPDSTGLETFRQLRKGNTKSPVIIITASGDSDSAIEAMKLGLWTS